MVGVVIFMMYGCCACAAPNVSAAKNKPAAVLADARVIIARPVECISPPFQRRPWLLPLAALLLWTFTLKEKSRP
jgi:hypothetical protein